MSRPSEDKQYLESLEARFEGRTRELLLLEKLNNAVNLGIPLGEVLQMTTDGVREAFEYHACDIYLYEKGSSEIVLVAISTDSKLVRRVEELTGLTAKGLRVPLCEGGIFSEIVFKKQVQYTTDMVKVFEDFTDNRALKLLAPKVAEIFGFREVLRAPLVAKDEVIGVIGVARDRSITNEDRGVLLRFAAQAALMIKKIQAEETLLKARDELEDKVRARTADLREINEELEREIAEGERTKAKLREALELAENEKAKTEAVISSVGDGISIQDRNFRVLYQNQAHKDLAGGDFAGQYCYSSYAKRENICKGCPVALTFEDSMVHTLEKSMLRENGLLHIEIKASPLRDSGGRIIGAIEVVRDISERKKLEEQLLHAQKMEVIGNLTGGISHEFNNIMTSIMGYGEIMQDEVGQDSPLQKYIDMILTSSRRAVSLTQGLMAYSRKQITSMEPVEVNEVIIEVEKILTGLIEENVQFRVAAGEGGIAVLADRGQVEQVLVNLATNALDAMPGGGTLSICSEAVAYEKDFMEGRVKISAGNYALIAVSDTGEGIYREMQDRIFEPFFTTKDVGKGTGLGLAVVYGIVKKHKGFITVHSVPGEGTTFKVYLPVCPALPEQEPAAMAPPLPGNGTVLLAEDDRAVSSLLRQVLEKHGYKVIVAYDGQEAVDKFILNSKDVQLLILDVGLPKKTGKGVYGEIQSMNPGIKALFVSGYTFEHSHVKQICDESMNFIPKPVAPKELLLKVRELLDQAGAN